MPADTDRDCFEGGPHWHRRPSSRRHDNRTIKEDIHGQEARREQDTGT